MGVRTLGRAGEITEIAGRLSSGRTSLLIGALRRATRGGAAAALVDADDAFDAAGAGRAGVDLARLLWVRCGRRRDLALRAADLLARCPGFAVVAVDFGELAPCLSLAAAFRLRLAVRRSQVALVVLSSRRIAGAGAALAVETVQTGVDWTGPARAATRLARLRARVSVVRARSAPPSAPLDMEWWCEVSDGRGA
ncbi:MAG: hypothetical protein FJZ38_08770 [Candidatus Rokubacteria bacterium]|nr:hypothetical protein [Candidatus Rokubacteria bacterium]